jgi:fucose permease
MLKVSSAESFKYCTVVTIPFFLWGFSYGLLNSLNYAVSVVGHMTTTQTLGLATIYFGGGYFFGPLLVGGWLLRRDEHHRSKTQGRGDSVGEFKTIFIVGLLIYGTGTIMFWPSAVLTAFGGFMISNFVVGFGLGVVETAANPFLALCGPPEYAEMRLLLAQGVQAVGSVISNLVAQKVFFVPTIGVASYGDSVLDVQWAYLAITFFCVLLALFFYYMPLPEVSDKELDRMAAGLPVDPNRRTIGSLSLRTMCIIFAVAAQWTYVAAQETMSNFFGSLVTALVPADSVQSDQPPGLALSVSYYLLIARTAFAVSRFAAGGLAYLAVRHLNHKLVPTPRTLLTASAALSALFALLTVVLRPTDNPNVLAVPVILFFFAEGPLWPLIFALGLRGQGRRTKQAAAWLTMGGSGPSFWLFVIYSIVSKGGSIQTAFIVVVALLLVTLLYPLVLTFVKDARIMVDPGHSFPNQSQENPEAGISRRGSGMSDPGMDEIIAERRRAASNATNMTGGGLLGLRVKKTNNRTSWPDEPVIEHQEDIQQERRHQKSWEDQPLDTAILE